MRYKRKKVFDETYIKNIKLRNRIIRSATWERAANDNGTLTNKLYKIYNQLSKGELGLIITGFANVLVSEKPQPKMMGIYDDSFIEEYKKLTNLIHNNNSKIVMEIVCGGSQSLYNLGKKVILGPSAVPEMKTGIIPKEMTKSDIIKLIKSFANAAYRIKASNFDGVQIHAAHGYLLSQFLNPYYNQRKDLYGGSIEKRSRIIFEIYEKIREKVGKDFAVLIKLNCRDFVDDEFTFEESKFVCKKLAEMGIDAIEISGGIKASGEISRLNILKENDKAYFEQYACQIAEEVEKPIILNGGIRSLETINRILRTTKIEYFSLSRPFLAEPHFVKRWLEGNIKKSRCISCNKCFSNKGNICIFSKKNN